MKLLTVWGEAGNDIGISECRSGLIYLVRMKLAARTIVSAAVGSG